MAKRQYKNSDWLWLVVKYGVLNGALLSGMACVHAQTNTPTDTDIIRDKSPLPGVDLYLDVTVNGNAVGLVHFGYENEKLYAGANTLRTLGFRLPEETTQPVGLNDIAQLNVDYNKQLQTLTLTVPLSELDLATTQLNPPAETAPMASSAGGALLNYDIYTEQGDASSVNTFSELRAFNGSGVLSTTQLTQYSTETDADNAFYRLDTSWRSSFQNDAGTDRGGYADQFTHRLPPNPHRRDSNWDRLWFAAVYANHPASRVSRLRNVAVQRRVVCRRGQVLQR